MLTGSDARAVYTACIGTVLGQVRLGDMWDSSYGAESARRVVRSSEGPGC